VAALVLALPARAGWEQGATTFLATEHPGPVTLTLVLMTAATGGRVGLEREAEDGTRSVEELVPAAAAGKPVAATVSLAPGQQARLLLQGSQAGTWAEALFERADTAEPLGWLCLRGHGDSASPWMLQSRFLARGFEVRVPAADTLVLGQRPSASALAGGTPAVQEAGFSPKDLDGEAMLELVKWVRERHESMINTLREQSEVVLDLLTLCQEGRTRTPEPRTIAQAKEAPVALDILEFALDLDYGAAMGRLEAAGNAADEQLRHHSREAEKTKVAAQQALADMRSGARTEAKGNPDGKAAPRPPCPASVLQDLDANLLRLQSWHDYRKQLQRLMDLTQAIRFPADQARDFRTHCASLLYDYLRVHVDAPALAGYLAQEEKQAQARKAKAGREDAKAAKPAGPAPSRPALTALDPNAEAARLLEARLRQEALDRDLQATAEAEARQRQDRRKALAGIRSAGKPAAGAAAVLAPGQAENPAGPAFTIQWHDQALADQDSHETAQVDAIHACLELVASCGLKTANRARYLDSIDGFPKLLELRPRGAAARLRPLLYRDGQALRVLRIACHGAEYPKEFRNTCKAAELLRQAWPAPAPGGGAAAPRAQADGAASSSRPAGNENRRPKFGHPLP
jgi:hypothetical protein